MKSEDYLTSKQFFLKELMVNLNYEEIFLLKNQKVLIMEDVITTGKSSMECSQLVKKNGGIIVGYACIIDRSNSNLSIQG